VGYLFHNGCEGWSSEDINAVDRGIMSDCVDRCQRLAQTILQSSKKARVLLDAIKAANKFGEKVEIECVVCDDNARHVAHYDRSSVTPSVLLLSH
jgi:hypothetical protein